MSSTLHADTVGDLATRAKRTIYVPLDSCEWRDSGDPEKQNETTIRGHAAVFNSLSEDLGGFREIIEPGFFRAALRQKPDVRLLFNHDPNFVLARTASGTLELREDQRGLHVFARVDKTIGWVADLRTSMQRGDVDQMSFAFTLNNDGDDWAVAEDGTVIRTLRGDGCQSLFDASVVTYPAYQATEVSMRSLLTEAVASGRLPETVGAMPGIARSEGVVGNPLGPHHRSAQLEARADVPSLMCLVDMWWDAQYFISNENQPDDGPDRDKMGQVVTLLEELMGAEANEPADDDVVAGGGAELEAMSAPNDLAELRTTSRTDVQTEKTAYLRLLQEISK